MLLRTPSVWSVGLVAALALGCQPDIGDACQLHSECSQTGNRICDPTFPGGYCTIFNCEPGTCPGEAVCVAYDSRLASEPLCQDPTERRFERTFCMKNCTSKSDCRTDYECVDLASSNNALSAIVLERDSNNSVCVFQKKEIVAPRGSGQVCSPGPYPDDGWRPPDAGAAAPTDASVRDASLPDSTPRDAPGGS